MSSMTSNMITGNSLWDFLPEDAVTIIFKYKIKYDFINIYKHHLTTKIINNIMKDNNWVFEPDEEYHKECIKYYRYNIPRDDIQAFILNKEIDFTISKLQDKSNQDYLKGIQDYLQCNLDYIKYFK